MCYIRIQPNKKKISKYRASNSQISSQKIMCVKVNNFFCFVTTINTPHLIQKYEPGVATDLAKILLIGVRISGQTNSCSKMGWKRVTKNFCFYSKNKWFYKRVISWCFEKKQKVYSRIIREEVPGTHTHIVIFINFKALSAAALNCKHIIWFGKIELKIYKREHFFNNWKKKVLKGNL